MENKYWNIEKLPDDIMLLFRNLSNSNKLDIKKIYDDTIYNENTNIKLSKKPNKKGASKKNSIIMKNKKNLFEKHIESDKRLLTTFKKEKKNNFEFWLKSAKTPFGKYLLKIEALKKAVKSQDRVVLLELGLQVINNDFNKKIGIKENSLIENIKKQLEKLPTKSLQLELLGNRLSPLDFYNRETFKLDDWQLDVLKNLKKGTSVIVSAPTSSGKTVLSTYYAMTDKTILYVVPSKPLALQIASNFHEISNGNVALLVSDLSYYPPKNTNIIVGTPYEIESKLYDLPTFDIVIYDEIHNLNTSDGDCYERIIKWHDGQFLALSATISNSNTLLEWFKQLNPNRTVILTEYQRRFINIQRYFWNNENKLVRLNPLSCLTSELITKYKTIHLPFTPYDCIHLYRTLFKSLPDDKKLLPLEPEIFFSNLTCIKLDDVNRYEKQLKQFIVNLPTDIIVKLLKDFVIDSENPKKDFDITNCLLQLKHKEKLPCIAFNSNSILCHTVFSTIIKKLEKDELLANPYYYTNLKYCNQLYENYYKKRTALEQSLKQEILVDRLMKFDSEELSKYQVAIQDEYQKNIISIQNSIITESVKIIQLKNLKKQYEYIIECNEILDVDIFEKNAEFCFNNNPMKANRIREIRKRIASKTNIKIDYTNVFLQGLKRGIGIYTKDLPEIYLQIVQELAQNKELAIVISDDSLAIGINMPFRSTLIFGWSNNSNITPLLYHQMSGRAGRRGLDSQGNVIFANINWKSLINSPVEKVVGNIKIPTNYNILGLINNRLGNLIKTKINTNYLYNYANNITNTSLEIKDFSKEIYNTNVSKIIWKLRDSGENIPLLVKLIDNLEINIKDKKLNKNNIIQLITLINTVLYGKNEITNENTEIKTINGITRYITPQTLLTINTLESNKLNNLLDSVSINNVLLNIYNIGNIIKVFHNQIKYNNYQRNTRKLLDISFEYIKSFTFNYHKFNSNN